MRGGPGCATVDDMSDMVRPVPPALRDLLAQWDARDRPPQQGSSWSLRSWQATFPEHGEYLASLPNPISRADAIGACREAPSGPEAAVRGFLAAMIWGYGKVGYGPYRTAHVLSDTAGAAATLSKVAGVARDEGGPAAFERLADNHLLGLGVAFATKYLFFCAAAGDGPPALVLDRLVRGWLAHNAGWSLRLDWRVDAYREYVETVTAWACELGCDPSELEFLMFAAAASSEASSQWAEPAFATVGEAAPIAVSSLSPEEIAVLEALDDAADAFAALPLSAFAADDDDFDLGVRQLRRIVLARSRT
jgi:hypothetical protein